MTYMDIYSNMYCLHCLLMFISKYVCHLGWGWCMPDIAAETLLKQFFNKGKICNSKWKILDLGCGDGLTGKALYRRGFTDLTGVDFSEPMMEKARARHVYKEVRKVDLLKELPFQDNEFDILVSTGVTTYLGKHLLAENLMLTLTSCSFTAPLLLSKFADPRGRPTVTAGSDNCFCTCRPFLRPSVRSSPLFQSKTNFKRKQCSLVARLWVWPSGSLMTPVLYFVFS